MRQVIESNILSDGYTAELYKGKFPGSRKKWSIIILSPNDSEAPKDFGLMTKSEATGKYADILKSDLLNN